MDILKRIVKRKKLRVEENKKRKPVEDLKKIIFSISNKENINNTKFSKAIKRQFNEPIKIIAELKKASPIKGLLKEFNIEKMSDIYVFSGVDAISIITEEDFFLGSPNYIEVVKKRHPHIPLLRKDFIIDEYQVYETKALQADALLLIGAIFRLDKARALFELSKELGMDVLFEVHDIEDLEKALNIGASIIGINNRNLKTMQIDLDNTFKIKELIPEDKIVVSESGISKREHVQKLFQFGIDAVLVGTSIILSENPAQKIKELKIYN